MDHYLDIHLLSEPEFPAPILMSTLFAKLHRALVQPATDGIGVSFPDRLTGNTLTLGDRLRLHGDRQALEALMAVPWLGGVQDHLRIGVISAVPPHAQPLQVRRVQVKSSPERLRRRQMRRHGLTEAQARERIPDTEGRTLTLPFVTLRSLSTGQPFRLFIQQTPAVERGEGTFNAYGLSAMATVPGF